MKEKGGVPHEQTATSNAGARRWWFRIGAAVLGPLVVLLVAELALRLGGYGYSTAFFRPFRIEGKDYLVENDKFGWRYFPPELARSPAPIRFLAQKPAGTCRVFLLGESAALGDPRPAYGAGRYLQALLEEGFPQKKIEVICVAMTAINSHALLDIARECARQQGDIWIVYMGNNEMVGPFGAATVFGPKAPSRTFVRLSLVLQETRVGQLLRNWGRKFRHSPSQSWAGMEMFTQTHVAPGAPARTRVYRNFRANLDGILEAGLASGAKLVLNTVAVNLKDSPPFETVSSATLSAQDKAACDQLLRNSLAALGRTNFALAVQTFAQASSLDPQRADVEFALGGCLVHLNNTLAARQHYQRACDLDALPFRADSTINEALAQAGQNYGARGLVFCDAAGALARSAPTGIPGGESFYEHVHFNFDGNYRLGKLWAEQVAKVMGWGRPEPTTKQQSNKEEVLTSETAAEATPSAQMQPALTNAPRLLSVPGSLPPADGWATQEICERRLGLTDWNRATVYEDMLRRFGQAPLSTQPNNGARWEALRKRLTELRQRMDGAAVTNARAIYLDALKNTPDDERLHENFAEFLEYTGQAQQAEAQWERVRELIPQHHLGYFETGRLLLRQAKLPEARKRLFEAVALRPDLGEAWLELGNIDSLEGKPAQALGEYQRAQQLTPQDPRPCYHLGKTLSKLGRPVEAVQQLRQAVKLQPAYWEAHYALGEELGFIGMVQDARSEFEQALRLKPDYVMAHVNLAVALAQEGKVDEALGHLQEAKRLEPKNPLVDQYLQKVQELRAGSGKAGGGKQGAN